MIIQINTYLKMINSKIRNIVEDQYKDKSAGIQAKLAAKVQKVLDEYMLKRKEKKELGHQINQEGKK